jgi:tRNA(His) 5'-end guanylyltransferase
MEIGDRMKEYEKAYRMAIMPNCPIMIRIDGKAFHSFTSNLKKPYDEGFMKAMDTVTYGLCNFSGAVLGYTQSDEITLVLCKEASEQQLFFNGKVQKLCSVLASYATYTFNSIFKNEEKMALFDCRVFAVPNLSEATNCLLWREIDARRNSIQMAARNYYSHKECNNKNFSDLSDMLINIGINWNNYPARFKRGNYLKMLRDDATGKRTYCPLEIKQLTQYSHEERIKILFGDLANVS